jgi:hypothetical protein
LNFRPRSVSTKASIRGIATFSATVPPYADVDGEPLDDGVRPACGDELPEHAVASTAAAAATARRRRTRHSLPHEPGEVTIVGVTTRENVPAQVPTWTAPLFLVLAVLLVPWIVYLGVVLPERATSAHWDVAWVGFDAMEFLALALTGWFAHRRSTWVEVAATAAAVLLVVDAWFDITTANGGWNLAQAVILGVGIELPLAAVALGVARHTELTRRRSARHHGRHQDGAR